MKDVEQAKGNEKAKGQKDGLESNVEIVAEDNTTKQFLEFALPTLGWAKETAKRLRLPDNLVNFNLPTQSMTHPSLSTGCRSIASHTTATVDASSGRRKKLKNPALNFRALDENPNCVGNF